MPYKIIADEVEHALRRLMETTSVEKTQEHIVDGALGPGAYERMKQIAAEEAHEIVRKLKLNHWRLEREQVVAELKAEATEAANKAAANTEAENKREG